VVIRDLVVGNSRDILFVQRKGRGKFRPKQNDSRPVISRAIEGNHSGPFEIEGDGDGDLDCSVDRLRGACSGPET